MPIIELIGILAVASLATAVGWFAARFVFRRKRGPKTRAPRVRCSGVTQRVASVGRFVALEVTAKEIATASSGPQWLPPALLTRAKVAMIFHFRHEYTLDLAALEDDDIRLQRSGRVKLRMPPIETISALVDLEPYDISSGKVLGLIEVIPMGAARQRKLMAAARLEAGAISDDDQASQQVLARESAETHIQRLLGRGGLTIDFDWSRSLDQPAVIGSIVAEETSESVVVESDVAYETVLPRSIRAFKPVLNAIAS